MKEQKLRLLIEFFKDRIADSSAWVIRKEVFAWTAAVLYLTGLFVLISNHSNSSIVLFNCIWLVPVLLFVLLLFFLLLIHTQFGELTNETAVKVVLTRWILKLIKDRKDLSLIEDSPIKSHMTFPDEIQKEIKNQQDYIRKYNVWCRPILPLCFICLKVLICIFKGILKCIRCILKGGLRKKYYRKCHAKYKKYKKKLPLEKLELEEALIYDLLLIAYILFVLFYWSILDC